ncbi:hypothetical protein ACJ41O_004716 [Fusarium nematophilum]
MALCSSCRLALRRALTTTTRSQKMSMPRTITTKSTASATSTAASILENPTWSVRSLLPSSPSSAPAETITPSQLHHLLRLSALPLPPTPAAEEAMITTLQNQLQFVRAVQRVDARDVEPLRAIRDETIAAREELALGVEDLSEVLGREMRVGKLQRVRRIREKVEPDAEKWDALSTARRTAGRYFVVESGKKDVEGAE